jgi:uracil-DNA glycosylase family 4
MNTGTLNLDARQRAMLDEMGVKVWWPVAKVAVETPVEAPASAPAAAIAAVAATAVAAPVSAPVASPAPVAARTAPAPVARPQVAPAAASTHGAAVLIEAPRLLYGENAPEGGWLIVADMPPELDGRHGEPFSGDAGRLLDNMLRALQLHGGDTRVHLMRTHRGVASGQPGSPQPLAESFADAVTALAPSIVLAMGPLAAQSLLQSGEPLGKLRGQPTRLALGSDARELPVVATYHPAYLLRNPADKARAWADLCLASAQLP